MVTRKEMSRLRMMAIAALHKALLDKIKIERKIRKKLMIPKNKNMSRIFSTSSSLSSALLITTS